jgi:hypothetical protein
MKRSTLIGLALLTLALVPTALAGKPTRTVLPPTEDFVSTECGFKVAVHAVQEQLAILEFFDEGNLVREIDTGAIKWTLTNMKTGQSVFVNLSGPGFLLLSPDGSGSFTGTGPWLFFENPETGDAGIFLLTGQFVVTFDALGNVEFTRDGRDVVDLCAVLAG